MNPGATSGATGQRREKGCDLELQWVLTLCGPPMEAWRSLAHRWMAVQSRALAQRLGSLRVFLQDYLHPHGLHDPAAFLRRGAQRPLWFGGVCPTTRAGIRYNNDIRNFIAWVLENAEPFSAEETDGERVMLPGYVNPVTRVSFGGCNYSESVRTPLPYKHIEELRAILAPGEHFTDWRWAHGVGEVLRSTVRDWLAVDERTIDRNDPDCVWRRRAVLGARSDDRPRTAGNRSEVMEIWSPARAVALLMKLTLPMRTHQVRMLDSGEADTDRLELRTHAQGFELKWTANGHALGAATAKVPVQRGVFRKLVDPQTGAVTTGFFINTNKTADLGIAPGQRGYVMPWQHETLLRWLVKLRHWQEKYNPITRPSRWAELDYKHLGTIKPAAELAAMPPACFLFRDAASRRPKDRSLPLQDSPIESCWHRLLAELERRCEERGERLANGEKLRFMKRLGLNLHHAVPFFPLHSLRVSLLTALALDGGVPLPVLSKLVAGHSRLLMTIYYVKIGSARMGAVLKEAEQRLQANAACALTVFLQEKPYDELTSVIAAVDEATLRHALAVHPAERNAVGWAPVHLGMCLVGANTSPGEGTKTIGGCYNGGELLKAAKEPAMRVYAPVRGGTRNCGACRWLVSEPHHLPRWVAHFNNVSYHLHEVAASFQTLEAKLKTLQAARYDAELAQRPFVEQAQWEETSRLHEAVAAKMDGLLTDARDTLAMVARLQRLLRSAGEESQQLVTSGDPAHLKCVLEETPSELLQLAGICADAALYPDLTAGKAVLRRSQFLDHMLLRENRQPVFLALDEATQHAVGNRLLQELARTADPQNPAHGLRLVTSAIETGEHLGWADDCIKHVLVGHEREPAPAPAVTLAKPRPALPQGAG